MTDTLQSPSLLELRAEHQAMVLRDLLGPAGGEEEELDERNVRGRYILGLLAPKGQSALPDNAEGEEPEENPLPTVDEDDDLATAGPDTEDGKADPLVPRTTTMLPSSLGLTFTATRAAQEVQISAHWGYYEHTTKELPGDPAQSKRIWKRKPTGGISGPIPLKPGRIKRWEPSTDFPDVYVDGLIRAREDHWVFTLFLINSQSEPKRNKDEAWVFQPELSVQAPDGTSIFEKRLQMRPSPHADPEEQMTQMLYRHEIEFAVGHGIAVHADLAEGRSDRAIRLTTRVAPDYEVPRVTPPSADEIPALKGAVLDMRTLAETGDADFGQALGPIITAYAQWIAGQQARLGEADLAPYLASARQSLDNCRATLERIRAGVELLGRNPQAAEAFRFANRAMWLQRIRSLYARQVRLDRKPASPDEIDKPGNRTWYPFQLAFVLLNLPSITDPAHPERSDPTQAVADLLWFPTGGGKTEAYLGLTAYTIALRRLQGEVGGLSGMGGVAVLMRYTLRVLTLQQFQRAAALICACESIRREVRERADPKWGDEPFRLGLWVGQRTTPNWTEDSAEAAHQARGAAPRATSIGGRGTPHQLTNCPWCGSAINPGRDIYVDTVAKGSGRTFVYCSDPECLFSRRRSPDEGIPALVVDEEIYRRLPALLIATVDKFAQLPWKGETQMLFGKVNGYCPRHGYRSPEIKDADFHRKTAVLPAVHSIPHGPLRPPDLIIQDELHLISGPLGTLVGLYETAVDRLASWQLNGHTVRPKVIASSATIRKAPQQVSMLYLRRANIFPPSGLDATDNFFARQRVPDANNPGRCYLGITAPGTRFRSVLIRVYTANLAAAKQLYEKYGSRADPWMTLVGYFNSMRELGGMRRAVEDSVRTRLQQMDERGLVPRYLSPSSVEELTSRKGATDIPEILDRLESIFDPVAETERKAKLKAGEKVPFARSPLDVLLATNMISVGVDVPRLGLMVVASQPKTTAEYIQATSRIGRHFPGLVCVVYNWARPRDLSHYERFEHYHATFFQHVEALSVTPFSARAIDRGLTALLVAYIRLLGDDFNANDRAGKITRDHPSVRCAVDEISRRAGLVTGKAAVASAVRSELEDRLDRWLARAAQAMDGAQLGYETEKDGKTVGLLVPAGRRAWEDFTCLNSLRDVEPPINLILNDYGMDREPARPSTTGENES